MADEKEKKISKMDKVKKWLMSFHLPIFLILAIGIGILLPQPGKYLAKTYFSKVCVFCIFIISGLKLDISSVKKALQFWPHFIIGLLFILCLTPLMGYVVLLIPIKPTELMIGIAVMCCVPTVLASSAILADQCGGSFALALLLSVSTNLLGVFVCPLSISLLFKSSGFKVALDVNSLLLELVLTIALPMIIGYCLQFFIPAVARFVKRFSSTLKVLSSLFLCMVPWVKMSESREQLLSLSLLNLVYVLIIILIVHYIFFILSYLYCLVFKVDDSAKKALVLTCSMKTLPIAMTIISFLPDSLGSQGVVLVPAILFHFTQLISGSFLAVLWTPKEVKKDVELPTVQPVKN